MKTSRRAERLLDLGLSDPAIDCVAGSLRKARLGQREEEEVARELVAHFQDGIASGRRSICSTISAIRPSLEL